MLFLSWHRSTVRGASLAYKAMPGVFTVKWARLMWRHVRLCILWLPAYQAHLLNELDSGKDLGPEAVVEPRRATNLSLHSMKQTSGAIGYSMAALVVTERLNLAGLK